jgi:hypothetical protein
LIIQGNIGIGGNDNRLGSFVSRQGQKKLRKMGDHGGGFGPAEALDQSGRRFTGKRGFVHFREVKGGAGGDRDKRHPQKAQKFAPAGRG